MKQAAWLAGWLIGVSLASVADEMPLNKRISVDYRGLPVVDVLKDLEAKSGVKISVAADLVQNADLVNYVVNDQEAGRVVTRILRPRGLSIRPSGDGSVAVFKLDTYDEFKVKREPVYEFVQKPKVTREGDRVRIAFETKAFCDVTVAIENAQNPSAGSGQAKIVRHLASGVLGDNAPEPFQWNAKKQTLTWDGKNDLGVYVDDKDSITVRVSLGLKPRYEKNLYWEPKRRIAPINPQPYTYDVLVAAAPEGVYVYDSDGHDHLRLFDHQGNYVRTVYPFPADKLKEVKGLDWKEYPQGYSRPAKTSRFQTSFLAGLPPGHLSDPPVPAGFSLAVSGDRVALVKERLSRLSTAGSSSGSSLHGPETWLPLTRDPKFTPNPFLTTHCCPWSAAFSPDGKKLYLAGFFLNSSYGGSLSGHQWLSGVVGMDYDGDAAPRPFVGKLDHVWDVERALTTSVACDSQGNVYVTDYLQNQIQVYDPQAKLLKSVAVNRPALLQVHPKTGEMFVFSWRLHCTATATIKPPPADLDWERERDAFPATLTVFSPLPEPKVTANYVLPAARTRNWRTGNAGAACYTPAGTQMRATVDFWTDPWTVWLVPDCPDVRYWRPWEECGVILFQPQDGKLAEKRNFAKDAARGLPGVVGEIHGSQRLFVNPVTEKLYVAESGSVGPYRGFGSLVEIDPTSGAARKITLPQHGTEDLAFDLEGYAYLRPANEARKDGCPVPNQIVRYDPRSWRQVPWDYGEERPGGLASVLPLPCDGWVNGREGGFWVSPNGHIAVACSKSGCGLDEFAQKENAARQSKDQAQFSASGDAYRPPLYPGRRMFSLTSCLHVWDRHGKIVYDDAVPGMPMTYGVAIDARDNLYILSTPTRSFAGKRYLNSLPGTLIKLRPGKNKFLSSGAAELPLSKEQQPKRPWDFDNFGHLQGWVEGAEWMYGGVGNAGFNLDCDCWQKTTQFALDLFARSFAPEIDQFSVAVLDTSGNLILRVGQYGNVDDGVPLDPKGAPPHPRSIGPSTGSGQEGDEVALMQACHVATLSDRFLYIADTGNARIAKVKLGYHAEEKVALKDVKDEKK